MKCIELNWFCKYMKKVKSSQAVSFVRVEQVDFFLVRIVKISRKENNVLQKSRELELY